MAEIFDPVWVSMFIIRIIFAIAVVFFMSYLILSYSVTLEDEQLSRFAYEIEETLAASQLTASRGVFSAEALDSFSAQWKDKFESEYDFESNIQLNKLIILGTDQSPYTNVEPNFARQCMFAYSASIKETRTEEKWMFGYQLPVSVEPTEEKGVSTAGETFPVSVMHGDGRIEPAEMRISAYITPLTRYSCLAERAKRYAKPQETGLPECQTAVCRIYARNFASGNNHICARQGSGSRVEFSELSCRYLEDTKIWATHLSYKSGDKKKLIAYPVKAGAGFDDVISNIADSERLSDQNCVKAKNNLATTSVEVDTIIFCLEERR